jgi:hypothetical protein
MVRTATIIASGLALAAVVVILPGCKGDGAAPADAAPAVRAPQKSGPRAVNPASPALDEVTLEVRKLGGAGGNQVLNTLNVVATVGEDFNVTEQVGYTQYAFSGKLTRVDAETFRVSYDYAEVSAEGSRGAKSTVELVPEKPVSLAGRPTGEDADPRAESLVIVLHRRATP